MVDVVENEAKMAYMRPPGGSASAMDEQRGPSKGFVVREAPWTTANEKVNIFPTCLTFFCLYEFIKPLLLTPCFFNFQAPDMSSSEDFPSFGAPVATKTSPWGPKRF